MIPNTIAGRVALITQLLEEGILTREQAFNLMGIKLDLAYWMKQPISKQDEDTYPAAKKAAQIKSSKLYKVI